MLRNKRFAQAVAVVAGLAMSLSSALPAAAVTAADLQQQINALMAQLAALQGGSSATVSVTYTRDLTVGSTGSDVTALQQMLVAKGYLTMPAGASFGYFGGLTKAAVARWQAAMGISPAAGYFGPRSRAAANGSGATGGTSTGGTTSGSTGGSTTGTISTPGAEGTLTVTTAPVSNSNVYAGDSKDPILSFKAQATGSDLSVQRVSVDLGASTNIYTKVFTNIYLVDDTGTVVASSPLNSSTVLKDANSEYYIPLTGFSSIVKAGTTRVYTVQADLSGSISSTYQTNYTIQLYNNGVRAVDGAGIDVYSPTTGSTVSKVITVNDNLSASADMVVSADSANPLSQEFVAASGNNNNQASKLALLVFDIKAEKSNITLTDLKNVSITAVGGTGATASTSYLFLGNGVSGTLLQSAALSLSTANFTNMSVSIPAGTTQTFTIAVDINSANSTQTTFSASVTGSTANVIGTAADGSTVGTVTGSATGNSFYVRNVGPIFALNSAPTISTSGVPESSASNSFSTSTLTATFSLNVKAVGADLYLGSVASATPMVDSANNVTVYQNGVGTRELVASSTNLVFDSNFVSNPAGWTNTFKLAQGGTGNVTVTFTMQGRTVVGSTALTFGNYAVDLAKINWVSSNGAGNSTFMSGQTAWRTPVVSMP